MRALRLLALLPFAAAAHLHAARSSTTACNNSPALCSKSYGEITHLGAHDSPFVHSSATGNSLAGDQYYDTTTQLDSGVRLVTAQVHKSNGEWRLCHTLCELMDAGLLSTWLGKIKAWLDDNPNDGGCHRVAGQLGQCNRVRTARAVPNRQYHRLRVRAQVVELRAILLAHAAGDDRRWQAAGDLRCIDRRLRGSAVPDGRVDVPLGESVRRLVADEFLVRAEPPPAVAGDISKALSSDRLPLMNHFLYSEDLSFIGVEYPNASYVSTTNAPSGGVGNLGSTATKCKSAWGGRQPTFILVDFFNKGPAIDTVDSLNNVTNAVGRPSGSASNSTHSSAGSTTGNVFTALVHLAKSARSGATPSIGNWVWVGGNWGSLLGGGISF
ncbi:hypothetical protein N7474_001257 [Penicillium riverlandense]|uniref:uncharacterized protein n=1 Tax=Penicillium riverlandense TaxID=1903569 RepID=UPI0025483A4E|nr:uncharacterized protein N7474_001257 [Penicillium riverlandense]KAJ5832946.1 hypothetical protein N7474_001257 [Penicillium riverlandense]